MKTYRIYLFRSPDCIRGWLSYLRPHDSQRATVTVDIVARSGPDAKNKAITAANKGFVGVDVVAKNNSDPLWGLVNFPDVVIS